MRKYKSHPSHSGSFTKPWPHIKWTFISLILPQIFTIRDSLLFFPCSCLFFPHTVVHSFGDLSNTYHSTLPHLSFTPFLVPISHLSVNPRDSVMPRGLISRHILQMNLEEFIIIPTPFFASFLCYLYSLSLSINIKHPKHNSLSHSITHHILPFSFLLPRTKSMNEMNTRIIKRTEECLKKAQTFLYSVI